MNEVADKSIKLASQSARLRHPRRWQLRSGEGVLPAASSHQSLSCFIYMQRQHQADTSKTQRLTTHRNPGDPMPWPLKALDSSGGWVAFTGYRPRDGDNLT
jgi:hypothetical protein